MSSPASRQRVGILPQEERMAIIEGARKLGLDPYEFGGFLSLESGVNMDPNIVGGAGGRHKGLIQFGSNEQKLYGITGPQTRASQMPKVLQYFRIAALSRVWILDALMQPYLAVIQMFP
jgi:hypothetical protein